MNPLLAFDSHCHLQDDQFADDREAVYGRARGQGIGMLVPGYTLETSRSAVALAAGHDGVWALVGVHPHDANTVGEPDFRELERLARHDKVVGIGEIGLDFYYNNSPADIQRTVFRRQLELAATLGLPVSVHSRDAEADTLAILREVGHRRGVLHCFTGSADFAAALLDFGFYISLAGPVTFKSAQALRDVARGMPLSRLLVETDSPYLSPVPWRGQRNEPIRVVRVAEIVAAQKNCLTEKVLAATMSNTLNLFFGGDQGQLASPAQ